MVGACWILPLLALTGAIPLAKETVFIGEGTNELATALLQSHVLKNENLVFSPLGLSSILAIFAEGSRGATRDEIASSLHFPDDVQLVRAGYQTALRQLLKNKVQLNSAAMRNWFYIYKNYTVDEGLKEILKDYYLTEVKSVERPQDFLHDHDHSEKKKTKVPAGLQGKPTDHLIDVDKEVEAIIENASSPHKSDGEEAASNVQPAMFDTNVEAQKNNEDQLPGSVNGHEKTHLSEVETDQVKKQDTENALNKVKKDEEKVEMMVATQRSENAIDCMTGMTDSVVKIKGNEPISQMIVFNGLYYKGNWNTPFLKMRAHDDRPFYSADDKKVFVHTLHAEGLYDTADIPELKSRAIDLKYEGGRYSLLILLPNERNGLEELVKDISDYPISRIYENLSEKLVDLCLPTFKITTISKPLEASNKRGLLKVNSIFKPETADLSGISNDKGLFIEELVQLVTFVVDSNYTEANFLSASVASSRSDIERVKVNHPFLFYLRDNTDGIIVVNGKVVDPTPTDEEFTGKSLWNVVRGFLKD